VTPTEVAYPTGHGQGMGYQCARLYLLSLCRGQARLNVLRALEATGICEARARRLTDSIVVFEPAALARREAEAWMRAIGHTDHEAA
jgi:hypothetical protein